MVEHATCFFFLKRKERKLISSPIKHRDNPCGASVKLHPQYMSKDPEVDISGSYRA